MKEVNGCKYNKRDNCQSGQCCTYCEDKCDNECNEVPDTCNGVL